MPSDNRLLIVEAVLPDGGAPHWAKDLDIRMLTILSGSECTMPEYAELLAGAGFRLESVIEIFPGQPVRVAAPQIENGLSKRGCQLKIAKPGD